MSETRLSTYLARTIREISRAGGLIIRLDDSTTVAVIERTEQLDQPQPPDGQPVLMV